VVSAREVRDLSEARGFDPKVLERVMRLLDILDALASDDVVAPRMALKGGTALNAFHAPLPRLSVDIDINYVGEADRARMLEDRPVFRDRILRIAESLGYGLARRASGGDGKWRFRYRAADGRPATLEIDLNYRRRLPYFGVGRLTSEPLGSHRAHDVPVVDVHEVIGGKLKALATRRKARDLFDALTVLGMPGLDWRKIRLAVTVLGAADPGGDWREASPAMIRGDAADVRASLSHCLPSGYFDAFGGPEAWMAGAVERCRRELAHVFERTEGERGFLDAFLDGGRIDADALEATGTTRAAIAADPGLNRLGNAIREGRFTVLGATARERRRTDRELRLLSAVTSRTPYSRRIHRRLHVEIRKALGMAESGRGIFQRDADRLAGEIAMARAATDLRVAITRETGGVPLHEAEARFRGRPNMPLALMARYDRIHDERTEALVGKDVAPTDLERVVARVVVATRDHERHAFALRMADALRCGTVPPADTIRAERQAVLTELSRPMGHLAKREKVALVRRVHESFAVTETLQICNGRGPLPETLESPEARANVRDGFRSLFTVSVPGPAPWARTHEALAIDMGIPQGHATRSRDRSHGFGVERW